MLSHTVFFTLKDASAEATEKLVTDCQKYLKAHDGIVFFAAGTRGEEFDRPVNDSEFHVALHVVFDNKESHDVYQVSDNHNAFIDANKDNWGSVRVFDAYVD